MVLFAPGACRWDAARRPIPGGTRETQEKSSLLVGQQMWHVLNGGEPDNRVV